MILGVYFAGLALPYLLLPHPALMLVQEMWLMGNRLTELPPSLCTLPALRQLSVADNALHTLPPHLGMLPCLEKLWAYGNALRGPTSISCFDAAMQGETK